MQKLTTIAVDTAKNVFEIVIDSKPKRQRLRLSREQFRSFISNHETARFVMEACGGAHHWARMMAERGHEVRMLPAPYVRPYRRRSKTDHADCLAMLEADKNTDILSVPIKPLDAQALQGLHRIRSGWMATRTARINALRGHLREFGIALPEGIKRARSMFAESIDDSAVPQTIKPALVLLLDEINHLESQIDTIERQLATIAKQNTSAKRLMDVPGIGLLTATALLASAGSAGSASYFRSGRHMASWIGLTPREHSSGSKRTLGGISKRGDPYLRMLLIHGARSLLRAASQRLKSGRPLDRLQRWAMQLQERTTHNKAACAVANKMARIAWACWVQETCYAREPSPAAA
ncbi:MAG: IS110 family transposase [Pseudomonadota bacterium]